MSHESGNRTAPSPAPSEARNRTAPPHAPPEARKCTAPSHAPPVNRHAWDGRRKKSDRNQSEQSFIKRSADESHTEMIEYIRDAESKVEFFCWLLAILFCFSFMLYQISSVVIKYQCKHNIY